MAIKSNADVNPKHLTEVLIFVDQFPNEKNSLFAEKQSGRLFLAETEMYPAPLRIVRGEDSYPMKQALPEDFHEITLREALEWFAKLEPYATESSGSVAMLCGMAAKRLN